MAIYTLPVGVARKKGSRGGSTFTRTCNGYIIRKRYTPIQPKTVRQTIVRSKFCVASKNYHALTAPQKAAFESSATTYERQNSLGVPYTLKANTLQNAANQNLLVADLPTDNVAQDFSNPAPYIISGGSAFVSPLSLEITVDPNSVPVWLRLQIWLSPIGVWSFPDTYFPALKLALVIQPGVPNTIDLIAAYEALHGTLSPVVASQIIVALQSFDVTTAIKSDYYFVRLSFI